MDASKEFNAAIEMATLIDKKGIKGGEVLETMAILSVLIAEHYGRDVTHILYDVDMLASIMLENMRKKKEGN